ncbi:hypothetical protein GCM10011490_24960 [Pseudoclavibacter endophyticus]|uniref:Uncharacterized protein n=1 Tax=Pseudoclavibacter endophyticus TaxID=1778590 RepID=A0A6H9WHF5_9MICO|nr:hypothetical protein [Pseudoclavibacter endophyticus]KAB1647827.1 hypothetical protein F8O04_12465 [Pseudoclavibacter endophyticus]GGA73143.1 hypothetical protein GCM10011490_24960 [Pseudoclavibacter endophyticus]
MTTPREWVPFSTDGGDEPTMGFGRAELLYALLAQPTPTAVQTAQKLGYAEIEVNDNTRLVGGSSLFAQGQLVTTDGETFLPVREAALLSRAAERLEAWITLGAIGDDAGEAMIGLAVDDALILIAPAPLGSFIVTLVPGGEHLLDVIGGMLAARLEAAAPGGDPVFLNVEYVDEQSSTMFVRRHPDDEAGFEVALGEGTESKPPILDGVQSGDDVDEFIADMLGVDAETGLPLEAPSG